MILTSNQSFGAWGEVFGDRVIATAIIDRLLHHAVMMNIRGNSNSLRDKLKAGLVRPHDNDNASQPGGEIKTTTTEENWGTLDTSRVISDWIGFYNQRRPHQALGMKNPVVAFKLAA